MASAFMLFSILVITAVLRLRDVPKRAALMCGVFVVVFPLFLAAYVLTPADLGFLPIWLSETDQSADLTFACLLYLAASFGGVLQLYNLADRGLSLRLLIDIGTAPEKALTADQLVERYSDGKGIRWMYEKRIADLLEGDLLSIHGSEVLLTKRGHQAAAAFLSMRRLLRLDIS
jgi:hypothetical protein